MRKSKNRYFYKIFVSPEDAPGAITLDVVWMEREFDAYKLPRSMYPSIFNSFPVIRTTIAETIQCLPNPSQHVPIYLKYFPSYTMLKSMRKSKITIFITFLFPLGTPLAPGAITLNVVWMEREFDAYKLFPIHDFPHFTPGHC